MADIVDRHFWTTIDRILLVAALLGAAFSAGYNYRGLDAMQKELTALNKSVADGFAAARSDFARKDVVDSTVRRIDERLATIEELLREHARSTATRQSIR